MDEPLKSDQKTEVIEIYSTATFPERLIRSFEYMEPVF